MSQQLSLPDRLRHAFATPNRGILGLVDELLAASLEQDLRLDWEGGLCQVGFSQGALADRIEMPLPRTVFRAVLARIATLCNGRVPNSVTPYGGSGEVVVDTSPGRRIRVAFVNTSQAQRLELSPVGTGIPHQDGGQSQAARVETGEHLPPEDVTRLLRQ
jgi:hypothetical protein